jgi:alpha/beta superfamily hydrolase
LHFVRDLVPLSSDPRDKLLVLAEHDEVRPPAEVAALAAGWAHTEVQIVPGASHFFVGRTDRLTDLVTAFVNRVVAAGGTASASR